MNIYQKHCEKLQEKFQFREIKKEIATAETIDFSHNDYFLFRHEPRIIEAAKKAAMEWGVGSSGARLLSGNIPLFAELEALIAKGKNTEAALLFISGYQANATALATLLDQKVLGEKPIVFFDKLNHASLYQACFLAQAELVRYKHLDMQDLAAKLLNFSAENRPKWIVSETLFGMDGDVLNLPELILLAKKYNTSVYLDEAHATGLLGQQGYGLSAECEWQNVPHVVMGTFSKAIGCSGAYIACSQIIKEYLINQCGGFIFSTAPSPMLIGAVMQAWKLLPEMIPKRDQMMQRAEALRVQLRSRGYDVGNSQTSIIPIIIGDAKKTIQVKNDLQHKNILVSSVRPPSVPPNSSRLRLALNTGCTNENVAFFINMLK